MPSTVLGIDSEQKDDSMSDKGVYRTGPATPSLLKI